MSEKRMGLSLEFIFTSEIDQMDFQRWTEAHPDAEPEQIIAHARANGAKKAILGDGTTWELRP